jgi:hypothetical protein
MKGLVMRIHHLNTGTMCPIGRRLVNGTGSMFQRARMVCHCLLVETTDGLALVDTGIGLDDIAQPLRLGRKWIRQTARLGWIRPRRRSGKSKPWVIRQATCVTCC